MEHNIITEPEIFAEVDDTTIGIEGITSHEPFSTGSVRFTFTQEDDLEEDDEDDLPETSADDMTDDFNAFVEFSMSTEQAIEFAMNIIEIAQETQVNQLRSVNQINAFRNATSECVRGRVGTLVISRSEDESPRFESGAILVDLTYLDDVDGDGEALHEITNLETHIRPFESEAQFEWLRSLVGGNHEFTSKIAIKFDNFSFEEIEDEWKERLGESSVKFTKLSDQNSD